MANSTINYYNEHAKSYYETTVGLDLGRLYQPFIDRLRPGAKVLDAGCGSGRTASFLRTKASRLQPLMPLRNWSSSVLSCWGRKFC